MRTSLKVMSDSMLFHAGSIHQGHHSFDHISRGRLCSFISFSALLFARNAAIEQWTAVTVDQILNKGDRFYLNALRRSSIPDAEVLSLNYLPNACGMLGTNSNYFLSTAHQDDSLICMAIRNHFVIILSTLLQCCIVIVM